jgi:hypothetical protein
VDDDLAELYPILRAVHSDHMSNCVASTVCRSAISSALRSAIVGPFFTPGFAFSGGGPFFLLGIAEVATPYGADLSLVSTFFRNWPSVRSKR